MLHYLDSRWRYKPTQIHVNAEWLNPDSGVIHPFNIELPTDGRLQVPIEVAVAMTDAPVTRAVLAAHIPDFVAEALARKFQEDLEEASKRSEASRAVTHRSARRARRGHLLHKRQLIRGYLRHHGHRRVATPGWNQWTILLIGEVIPSDACGVRAGRLRRTDAAVQRSPRAPRSRHIRADSVRRAPPQG